MSVNVAGSWHRSFFCSSLAHISPTHDGSCVGASLRRLLTPPIALPAVKLLMSALARAARLGALLALTLLAFKSHANARE